ncbi:uncharacterized protein At3g27210 [Trifolium pratense]|uniref:uncharacterized protein At3g27210 n=1 Tax=Trifolium pratense TaxID=57577 RepID=UPI001E6979A1|nr:uncharacterized protein At3g27210 [Trifolium pratense]
MGSCNSVHRNSICSKTVDKLVILPSPIKDKPKNDNFMIHDVAVKSQLSPSQSTNTFNVSKEEAFFDSKGWLDSDCEDDFYSVNGEFTPSRGNTPVHHTFATPAINKTPSGHVVPEPSPRKKNLLELFKESVRENQNGEVGKTYSDQEKQVKPITIHDLTKSAQSTPYISGGNSACSSIERTMKDENESVKLKPVQCCLPSLASYRSFSERRRNTSRAIAANGKV